MQVQLTPWIARLCRQHRSRDAGFTLLELMVVVMISALLSAIALPSLLSQVNKARQSEAKTYVAAINRGQQAYFLEKGSFANLEDLNLVLSQSGNYTYSSSPSGSGLSSAALTIALPLHTARGYAGKVWISVGGDGSATAKSIVCEGGSSTPPAIAGDRCPH